MNDEGLPPVRWLRRFGRRRAPRSEDLEEHPTPEALTAYDANELTPDQDDRIQEHFLECRDCPELLLDYKSFSAPDAAAKEVPDLSDSWVAAAWEALRARLAGEPEPGGWRSLHRRMRLSFRTVAHRLAAGLLACSVGLSWWILSLSREIGQLQEPQLNLPVAYLHLPIDHRGKEEPAPSLLVPAGAPSFLLVLTPLVEPFYPEYRLEIRTSGGAEVWSGGGLTKTADGTFHVGLSRRFLRAGEYRIRLFGLTGGPPEPIEEYAFRLLYR